MSVILAIGHGIGLVLLSIIGGAIFGALAAVSMGAGFMAEFGAIFGAAVGLLASPVFAWSAWRDALVVTPAVFVPTAVVAVISGALVPPNGGPLLLMAPAVGAFIVASIVTGVWSWSRGAPAAPGGPPSCRACGYDLSGLHGCVCPECGGSLDARQSR